MPSLSERYRPTCWSEVVGQDKALAKVHQVGKNGYGGRAYFLTGGSGTGKTSIARLIAAEVADPFCIEELDGSKLTADKIREIERTMHVWGWGKGGRAFIMNEVHGISKGALKQLLTLLEPDGGGLPGHVVFVFTTTSENAEGLFEDNLDAGPFLSRCNVIALARRDLAEPFAVRAREIAEKEGLNGAPPERYRRLAKDCGNNLRMMLSEIEQGTLAGKGI
jgi:DNA polymerase-3 subunit gamma/tau